MRKWEARLNELKTPREYAALARELDIAKKTNQTAEEEIKRLGGEYVEVKAQVDAAEQALLEKETVAEREGAETKTLLEGVSAEMAALESDRKRLVELCDKSLVSRYERIRKQRGGVAVVPVIAGTCKGCQRNIPAADGEQPAHRERDPHLPQLPPLHLRGGRAAGRSERDK